MHLYHKWENVFKRPCTVQVGNMFKSFEQDGMAYIERCKICGKEKGRVETIITIKYVNPDIIRSAPRV